MSWLSYILPDGYDPWPDVAEVSAAATTGEVYGPQPYAFDPFATPTAEHEDQAVAAVQAQSGEDAAMAVAAALDEARLSRKRKALNTLLTVVCVALAITAAWFIYKTLKRA